MPEERRQHPDLSGLQDKKAEFLTARPHPDSYRDRTTARQKS